MTAQKKRNSSIELLRIICMLLIVAHHYVYYGIYNPISYDNFTGTRVFLQLAGAFGQWSCAVFAIISGYYISNIKFDSKETIFKHYKKVLPMVAQFVLYSVLILLVLGFLGKVEFSAKNIIESCLPFIYGNWYVRYYIIFFLFVPYLNILIDQLSEKMFTALLAMSLIIWSVIPMFVKGSFSFSCEEFFLVMYFIGVYLRKYLEKRLSNKAVITGCIISFAAYILSILFFDYMGYYYMNNDYFVTANSLMNYNKIITIALAVFVFLLFNRIHFYNYYVNIIASAVMGVYLIHDNNLLKYIIWREISPNNNYAENPYLHLLVKVIVVFIVCVSVDMIRSVTVAVWLKKPYDKILKCLWNKIESKETVAYAEPETETEEVREE